MQFKQYYSGSSGNLYTVTANNGKRLLIECGVTFNKILKALEYDLKGIEACFVTHGHKDHCKAIRDVLIAGIDVYSSESTFTPNQTKYERRTHIIKPKDLIRLDTFEVLTFKTHHDCEGSLGFIVRADNEFLLFATDTSHISQRVKYKFAIIAIECSYDKEILEDRLYSSEEDLKARGLTKINESLAKRLLTSHMEKQNCINYLANFCDLSKCRQIHLLHMSSDNVDKEQTRKEIEERFFIKTIYRDKTEAKDSTCQHTQSYQ